MITSTDKSSRFAVLSREQYLKSGTVHTSKDERVTWSHIKYIQNQVNSHVWWLSRILGYSKMTDETRMLKNVSDSGFEVPEMAILVKDHKKWNPESGDPIPSRPIVCGNQGLNTHLSELISELTEPIVLEHDGAEV